MRFLHNEADHARVTFESYFHKVGKLCRVGDNFGGALKLFRTYADFHLRIRLEVADPVRFQAARRADIVILADLFVLQRRHPLLSRLSACGGQQEDDPADERTQSDRVQHAMDLLNVLHLRPIEMNHAHDCLS
ncbi:MAG: hypothetical protein AUJ21_09515 [Anaerolineae bacterium CG1_02_58_13]|nr:MAG: hypothetical protein AUJ21_09515 [Anaerolineae bacterium CG1_02_58_13]